MLKNYFFDFDKTLADSTDAAVEATQEAYSDNNLHAPKTETILDQMGIPAQVSFAKMAQRDLSESEVQQLVHTYRQVYKKYEKDKTQLYLDIRETLASLERRKKKLFVVSSKDTESLNRNLENLSIKQYFLDVVGCDQVRRFKPAPDSLLLLINHYHLQKDESVMIGDARYDLQMGKAAGIKTCGATWGAFDPDSLKREKPTYLLGHVKDLLTIK